MSKYNKTISKRLSYYGYPKGLHGYFRSKHWKKIIKHYYNSGRWPHCIICLKSPEKIILKHVAKSRIGSDDINNIVPLCKKCNNKLHDFMRKIERRKEKYKRHIFWFMVQELGRTKAGIRMNKYIYNKTPSKF